MYTGLLNDLDENSEVTLIAFDDMGLSPVQSVAKSTIDRVQT